MDAAADRDVKLQRASGDLVGEFSAKLPSLLWKIRTEDNGHTTRTPRRWTPAAKTEKLIGLLEPFQEWPQLLDPHLQKLLPPLVDVFLAYLLKHRNQYVSGEADSRLREGLYPVPRAVCRLLYTFCKVRGVKVISRFLNNEPKYLDPLLRAFIEWDAVPQESSMEEATDMPGDDVSRRLVWEERYVMLIWLSHLLLAPFDLASMSSDDIPIPYGNLDRLKPLLPQAPAVTKSLLSVSLNYVDVSGKEREAATALLARLALRRDMLALGILTNLTDWAFSIVQPADSAEPPSLYTCIGILSFLARLAASGQAEGLTPLVEPIFEQTLHIAQGQSQVSKIIRSSALARKIMVKILRSVTVMALSLNESGGSISDNKVSTILEEVIDHLLVSLADKDTPVRFASSKALSIITLKLDPDMAVDVIEAVTGSLEENILYEKRDGIIVAPFEARKIGINMLKRNLSAIDAQQWQGLILTLGHLLFRRAPPTHQLHNVLQPLVSGLDFEQRSSTGSSVGTGVRDASCFGIWALSRKYTTQELLALNSQAISTPTNQKETSILQMLAVELVCAACVDPSGNIRRGSSAALQELIGRHPNTIAEGISLVQVVDYHAVARRSRAMIDVAKATADLNDVYWSPLVESLMHWRGIGSPDAESRRNAAKAIGILSVHGSYTTIKTVFERLLQRLSSLPRNYVEARHGCMLSIAATVDAYSSQQDVDPTGTGASDVSSQIAGLWEIFGSSFGPSKDDLTLQSSRPELTAEACSCLIDSLSRTATKPGGSTPQPSDVSLNCARKTLLLCVSRGEAIAIEASSNAFSQMFPLLPLTKQDETVQSWSTHIQATRKLPTGRGQISALGAIFKRIGPENRLRTAIIEELLRCTWPEELIEKRVAAVKCLSMEVLPYTAVTDEMVDHFVGFLNDYTTDRRGDIGSLLRLEAIEAAKIILQKDSETGTRSLHAQKVIGCLCRLAAEKLDKVRVQAWLCLQSFWELAEGFPPLQRKYDHFSHVSFPGYFLQLLELQAIDWLRLPLLKGFATSAIVGAEGLIRASRLALVQCINAKEAEEQQAMLLMIVQDLSTLLSDNLQDDRYAIPIIELLAFLIDGYIPSIPEGSESMSVPSAPPSSIRNHLTHQPRVPSFRKLFVLVQKAHFKTSNLQRLEAAIKIYAPLSRFSQLQPEVFKKMTAMLLHPFPRVRTTVSDYLFTETESDMVKMADWTRQPKELKGEVETLRGVLVR